MGSFNPLNFLKDVWNASINSAGRNPHITARQTFIQVANQTATSVVRQPVQNPKLNIYNPTFKLANLSGLEQTILMKDLMNIPKDYKDFLYLMQSAQYKTINPSDIKSLLTQNFDFAAVAQLLQQNSKEAVAKLVQMIASAARNGITDTVQLKEIMTILGASIPINGTNTNTIIKNIMLMYLPWLPLGENSGFEMEIEGADGKPENERNESLTILIQTKNFGNVKALLNMETMSKVSIEIYCTKAFPKEEFYKTLKSEAKQNNLSAGVVINAKEVEIVKNASQNVKISAKNALSPYILLASHTLIKTIFELDEKYALADERQKRID